jgi:hypothetical protein
MKNIYFYGHVAGLGQLFWVIETLFKDASHCFCADFHATLQNVTFKRDWAEESS